MPRQPWLATVVLTAGLLLSACGTVATEPVEPGESSQSPSRSTASDSAPADESATEARSDDGSAGSPPEEGQSQAFPLTVGGPVPDPFGDAQGVGATPREAAPLPDPAIPDPIRRSPLERAELMNPPPGVAAVTPTPPPHWQVLDTQDRGWVGPAFTYAFLLDTPGMREEGYSQEFDRSLYAEFNVLYVGDLSDIRDGISLYAEDKSVYDQSVIDVAGYPAVLTVPADGGPGLYRIEMAIHGELIVADNDIVEVDGEYYGMNAEQLIDMTEQYLGVLYGDDL